jgi:hypothetical protein
LTANPPSGYALNPKIWRSTVNLMYLKLAHAMILIYGCQVLNVPANPAVEQNLQLDRTAAPDADQYIHKVGHRSSTQRPADVSHRKDRWASRAVCGGRHYKAARWRSCAKRMWCRCYCGGINHQRQEV